jgi:hypothetical protein
MYYKHLLHLFKKIYQSVINYIEPHINYRIINYKKDRWFS